MGWSGVYIESHIPTEQRKILGILTIGQDYVESQIKIDMSIYPKGTMIWSHFLFRECQKTRADTNRGN